MYFQDNTLNKKSFNIKKFLQIIIKIKKTRSFIDSLQLNHLYCKTKMNGWSLNGFNIAPICKIFSTLSIENKKTYFSIKHN